MTKLRVFDDFTKPKLSFYRLFNSIKNKFKVLLISNLALFKMDF